MGMTIGFCQNQVYLATLFGQNQLHAKNKKYKTHPGSPAIGQADIVTDFGSKLRKGQARYTWFSSTLSSFQLISWPTLNQSERRPWSPRWFK